MTQRNEDVDIYSGGFTVAVEGKKIKLILDEPLPKPLEIAMRGKPSTVSGKSSTFVIEWTHKIPVQLQQHVSASAESLINRIIDGESPASILSEVIKQLSKEDTAILDQAKKALKKCQLEIESLHTASGQDGPVKRYLKLLARSVKDLEEKVTGHLATKGF